MFLRIGSGGGYAKLVKKVNNKIDTENWYSAREAADFLDVTENTIKKYCRVGDMKGKQVGRKQKWHIHGGEIKRFREKWGLDTISR